MTNTTNFNFRIPDGTDNVNLLTQNYPNWTDLDAILKAIKDTGITAATATKTGTNFAVVRSDADLKYFGFVATNNYDAGDTFTVDGVPVTATSPAGTALPQGAFVINQNVLCALNGAVLTVYAGGAGGATIDAEDVDYDNAGSGLTATDVQAAIDEIVNAIPTGFAASAITYDNTLSGLTATDVQAAIDELKALIPAQPQYITTGLSIVGSRCAINSGGYYIDNGFVYVDIVITLLTNVAAVNGLITDFPMGVGTGAITPSFNNAKMYVESGTTMLVSDASLSSGTTIHFIGSYQMV